MVPIAWPPSTSLLLQCCLFKSEEQTEIAVKTPAQSLCGPTGMRRSMLGLLAFSVCVLEGNDLSQTKLQISIIGAQQVQERPTAALFPLSLFLSRCLFFLTLLT